MVPNNSNEIDKLLALAEAPPPKKEQKANPEIDKFIVDLKIHNGKTKVPDYIIYYTYYIWKEKNLITRQRFSRYFGKKFKRTQVKYGYAYFLDPRPFNLTPVGHFLARAYMRKESEKTKKK